MTTYQVRVAQVRGLDGSPDQIHAQAATAPGSPRMLVQPVRSPERVAEVCHALVAGLKHRVQYAHQGRAWLPCAPGDATPTVLSMAARPSADTVLEKLSVVLPSCSVIDALLMPAVTSALGATSAML